MTLPVVVTGVSSGIGAATAELLVATGIPVIGVDRHRPQSPVSDIVETDLSTPSGVAFAVARVRELAPHGIAGLMNVAGLPGTAPWRTVISVNVLALRDLTSGLLPLLRSGGVVVHLASSVADGWQERAATASVVCATDDWDAALATVAADSELISHSYRFSKECVRFLTERQAAALLRSGTRVVSVSPGPVETPILEDFKNDHGRDKVESAAAALGRFGTPDDVAQVVRFLLDPASRWINGTDVRVDGGLAAYRASTPGDQAQEPTVVR